MRMYFGNYTGTGSARSITGVPFQPDFVLVSARAAIPVWFKTTNTSSTNSLPLGSDQGLTAQIITALNSDGFSLGTSGQGNQNGTVYDYVCFKDNGLNDFAQGTYTGNGVNGMQVTVGWQPDIVIVKRIDGTNRAIWKPSNTATSSTSLPFIETNGAGNLVTALNATGFTVGTDAAVNTSGASYQYIAFKQVTGSVKIGSYTGNSTNNRAITGVGFNPDFIWVKADGNNLGHTVGRFSAYGTDGAKPFSGVSDYVTNTIKSNDSDGFTVGTGNYVNFNNEPYYYLAFHNAGQVTVGFTAKAKIVNLVKRFTAKARITNANVLKGFTAQATVFPKTVQGGLYQLKYRSIDLMKWQKDLLTSQPSDTLINNLLTKLNEVFNLTHVAMVFPIDPISTYPSGFTPSPRSVVGTYQYWVDAARAKGLRILHRSVSFHMEGVSGFTKYVGGSRYYQGHPWELLSTYNFSDDYNRQIIPTYYNAQTVSSTDTFSSLSTTTYNTSIGNWSISGNELVCTSPANATNNVLWTKTNYTDFTIQGKIKLVSSSGFTGMAFRMTRDTNNGGRSFANYFSGYVAQIRSGNELRVENISTSNLAAVSKTYSVGSYYQMKVTCTGNRIQVKTWLDGTTEPSTWDLDFTDSTYTSGGVGFCPENTTTTAVYDDLTIQTLQVTQTISYTYSGNWSISNNTLTIPTAGSWGSALILTKQTYRDTVITARIQKTASGNQMLAFRSSASSGYGVQLRGSNEFRLEKWGQSNLQAAFNLTLIPGNWYQVKVNVVGNRIQARIWNDGGTEPSTWDIDYTDASNSFPTGFIGFGAESGSNFTYDDLSITVTPYLNSYLGWSYNFVLSNPTLYANGDGVAFFPERTENIFSDSTSFLPGPLPQNFATFFIELKEVLDFCFDSLNLNVDTSLTANNYSEVRSGWIPQTLFDAMRVVSVDYYQNYNGDGYGASQFGTDLAAIYSSRGYPVFLQEWGMIPEICALYADGAVRKAFIRSVYDQFVTLANAGKLIGFNYWGFWDTGSNDSGLASISGTNIKVRYGGWILAEYFNGGSSPNPSFTAKARVVKQSNPTFTARARVLYRTQVGFTARARIINPDIISGDNIRPRSLADRTGSQVNNDGITYNEAGVTYNDPRYSYGGSYGYSSGIKPQFKIPRKT